MHRSQLAVLTITGSLRQRPKSWPFYASSLWLWNQTTTLVFVFDSWTRSLTADCTIQSWFFS